MVGSVFVGLFAYENKGTLFNCAVVTEGETNIEVETSATQVSNGLFVTRNAITGSISNSRVGYIEGVGERNNVLHFASYTDIAGFVAVNEGHIASSFARDISLKCKELNALDIDETGVAGFAVTNASTGKIYFSYVEGIRGDDTEHTQIQLSSQGYKKYNTGIYSPGIIAGFVFTNNGYIQDTYTNIPLISPTSSTGYVYENGKDANIINAFSTSLQPTTLDGNQEEYPNTSRSQFTGLGDLNEVLNEGNIEYAYYYNAEYDSNIFTGLGEPALALPADSFHDSLEEFGNFVGGDNMIWEVDTLHPQLVSANRIIKRQRYLVNNLTGDEDDETLSKYVYYYEDKVDGEFDVYGSYTNPIIISSGAQFVEMGDETRLVPYTNTSTNTTTITTLNRNDYIVIRDIDVSTVIDSGLEDLQSITYAGMLEGNGFTFKNVSILSEKSSRLGGVSFGMFEQIGATVLFENDILVTVDSVEYHSQIKNLTIQINAISGTHATAVGTLAGVIVNSDIINIHLQSNAGEDEKVTVQGERYVGSVAGYVAGNSNIVNITSDLSVSADFRNKNSQDVLNPTAQVSQIKPYVMGNDAISNSVYAYKFAINTVDYTGGYAGGIAGLVDIFTLKLTKNADTTFASISRYDYDKTGYNYVAVNFKPQVVSSIVKGEVEIIGDVAGGIVGLNYQGTSIYNARFMLELGEAQKISGEIIAGGLVGQNYGKIDQSALTHERNVQLAIDDGTTDKTEVNQNLFYESNKYPIFVGGLVGYDYGLGSNSGVVTNCYSRANVNNYNASYVGGMVGYMASGYLQYCYVTGNVTSSQEREDPQTGQISGTNGIASGAVAYLASFVSKNSIKYFTEYTGLSYYSMWSLVCANDWNDDVNLTTTSALIGYAGSSVKLEEGIINGDMDIFVNNMDEKLPDVLKLFSKNNESYNIINIIENAGSISKYRLISSYSYETFKKYNLEGADPDENILYQTWDRNIWDVTQPYFPLLLLNTNGDQTYITNEEELRSIVTDVFYIIQNYIYLTKDWITVE
ncbi:MAG: hypothetical protein IJW82_07310, partial [Clostridia bacterium]|nr:hypothetical protein [Clostridia bacterium]